MQTREGCVSLPTGGVAFAEGSRVVVTAGALALAGATVVEVGIVEKTTLASDTYAAVRPLPCGGTVHMIASGAIAQYADVYRAASGRVSATVAAGHYLGIAMTAASGNNSIIEVLSRL